MPNCGSPRVKPSSARHRATLVVLLLAAAAMYFFQLGRAGFDDAEAYSAFIASRSSVAAVYHASLQLDPGKGGALYVILLHWYCAVFGTGEAALRAFSAAFALLSVMLVYMLAGDLFDDLFGPDTALCAAALWACNPIALIVARWARMYSLFIALALAGLLAMRKLRRRPSIARILVFGTLGAAMLDTHLGGALMLGAEAAIVARDRWRGRACLPAFAGLALAACLFMPIAPSALAQVRASALGHRFDWMGSAPDLSPLLRLGIATIAAALGVLLIFGPALRFDRARRSDDSEPMRWCAIWSFLPLLALTAGSLILHPMFEIRYIAPVMAGLTVLVAAALGLAGARTRGFAMTALLSAMLIPPMLFQFKHQPFDLWPRMARGVADGGAHAQEVFFEAGYVMSIRQASALDADTLIEVLPEGYLRIPFDYYFRGANRRHAINPFRFATARATLAQAARRNGGAWLVSHMGDDDLALELPPATEFSCERMVHDPSVAVSLYHIVPREHAR